MLYVNLIAKNKKTHEGTKRELKAASLPVVLSALCEHETSQTKIIFKHFCTGGAAKRELENGQ